MQPTDQTSTGQVVRDELFVFKGYVYVGKHTSFCVALEAQHDFRGAIPPSRHIFRHVAGILLRVDREASGKTEIANLELAVGVDKQVAGFEISVQHIGGVDVL